MSTVLVNNSGRVHTHIIRMTKSDTFVNSQGVLPWPRFWASTKPFGTPLGPYFVKWLLTIIMILAPPAGDAFAFGMIHSEPPSQPRLLLIPSYKSHRSIGLSFILFPASLSHRSIHRSLATASFESPPSGISRLGRSHHFHHSRESLPTCHAMVPTTRRKRRCILLVRHLRRDWHCDHHWMWCLLLALDLGLPKDWWLPSPSGGFDPRSWGAKPQACQGPCSRAGTMG